MMDEQPTPPDNTISGGIFYGPVLQGRDIRATFHLPAAAPTALAQLPPLVTGFTGRDEELTVLTGLLDPAGSAGPVVVSAVAGLAGVGKTALAIQAGHAAMKQGWFGGGVLFIDLHGYDVKPVEAGQALDALLRALGVPAEHIPPTADEQAGLYRSVLGQIGEPVLVIIDNASTEAQVRPLLPGTGPHKVLVTSRHTLAGLGARLVDVTLLDEHGSVELLNQVLQAARPGDDRITADPAAADRLAEACGGLPLALQITAALLQTDPALRTAELADQLSDENARLHELQYDDGSGASAPSVAAAFELSYQRLDETQAQVFRLLPVNPGRDVSTAAIAVLAGMPLRDVRKVLASLARAHLVETTPATAGRWRMHDLVRLYADELSDAHAEIDGRDQACDRMIAYYLEMANAAGRHLRAHSGMTAPEEFTGRDAALDWMDAERTSLVAVVQMAADTGRDQAALRLPLLLHEYFDWRRRFDDWLTTAGVCLEAARRLGDRHGEGDALTNLGMALWNVRKFEEAETAYRDAAAIFHESGPRHREGRILTNLGNTLRALGRFEEAITTHEEAARIFRQTGDRNGEGDALINLGVALRHARKVEVAIIALREAAAIFQETGNRRTEAGALTNLGAALCQAGRFEDGIIALREAAAIFGETGDRHSEGLAMMNLGQALRGLQRFDEAISAHQHAIAIFRETSDEHYEHMAMANLDAARTARQA